MELGNPVTWLIIKSKPRIRGDVEEQRGEVALLARRVAGLANDQLKVAAGERRPDGARHARLYVLEARPPHPRQADVVVDLGPV